MICNINASRAAGCFRKIDDDAEDGITAQTEKSEKYELAYFAKETAPTAWVCPTATAMQLNVLLSSCLQIRAVLSWIRKQHMK